VPPPPLDTSSDTSQALHDALGGGPAVSSTPLVPGREDATPRPPVPVRAAGVELLGETPGSGYREPPSLVRRGDGQTVQLTPLLYEVLRAADGRRDYRQVAAEVSERVGRTASARDVLFLAEAKLRPLGLLRGHDGTEPEVQKANPLLALKCRVVITDPTLTRRITSPFAALFRPSLVLLFLAAFLWSTWWVFFEQGLISGFHQALYEPHLLLLVFALTLVSAGFHEFGHAAACRYGGATPGAMGFGLYLIWPAFYTDVTDSYRLGRGGRLRVDLGGLYFNVVFAVGTFAAWAWLRADALLLLIFAQVLQMSRQLVPLVRFDGYHILADLIGVPDLFAHMKPTLLGLLPSRWRTGQHQALKPWARAAVTLWVLVTLPLLLLMLVTIVRFLPRLAATTWDSLGLQWEVLGTNWADGAWADVGIRILSIVSLALPVLTITYLIARVVRRVALWAWRASAGSTPRQAAAGAGALAIIAAVALAWWPQGQYVPLDADEDGTLPELFAAATLPPATPAAAETDRPAPVAAETDAPAVAATDRPTAGRPAVAPAPSLPPGAPIGPPQVAIVVVPSGVAASGTATQVVPSTAGVAPHVLEPIVGDDVADGGDDWLFPWRPPPPTSEGDNRAVVINTEDGSTAYDLAFAFVWVTDGEPIRHRNDALAYASCRDCKSVAVAFQVILVIGQVDEIVPVNVSEAGNFDCEACTTHALAVQLIATLRGEPDEQVLAALGEVWASLEQLEANAQSLSIEQMYTWLRHVEVRILSILADAGLLLDGNVRSADAEGADLAPEVEPEVAPEETDASPIDDQTTSEPTPATDSASTDAPDPATGDAMAESPTDQSDADDGSAASGDPPISSTPPSEDLEPEHEEDGDGSGGEPSPTPDGTEATEDPSTADDADDDDAEASDGA
jgi:putative peptide zinc metalloprotease protein